MIRILFLVKRIIISGFDPCFKLIHILFFDFNRVVLLTLLFQLLILDMNVLGNLLGCFLTLQSLNLGIIFIDHIAADPHGSDVMLSFIKLVGLRPRNKHGLLVTGEHWIHHGVGSDSLHLSVGQGRISRLNQQCLRSFSCYVDLVWLESSDIGLCLVVLFNNLTGWCISHFVPSVHVHLLVVHILRGMRWHLHTCSFGVADTCWQIAWTCADLATSRHSLVSTFSHILGKHFILQTNFIKERVYGCHRGVNNLRIVTIFGALSSSRSSDLTLEFFVIHANVLSEYILWIHHVSRVELIVFIETRVVSVNIV